jgi:hypothetical protein
MQQPAVPPQPSAGSNIRLPKLSRWWSKGIAYRIALLATIPLLAICVCCSAGTVWLISPAGQQAIQETEATETAQAFAASHATATAAAKTALHPRPTFVPTLGAGGTSTPIPTDTPTLLPIATPVPASTATAVPSTPDGPPYVGGSYSNFVATYGQPFGQGTGDSANFYTDAAQTIVINVSPTSGTVTHIDLVAPDSWSDQETHDYLVQFLPSDAALYNSVAQYTDYHSSIGDLVIGVFGQGTGVVSLVQ